LFFKENILSANAASQLPQNPPSSIVPHAPFSTSPAIQPPTASAAPVPPSASPNAQRIPPSLITMPPVYSPSFLASLHDYANPDDTDFSFDAILGNYMFL
jgi:hypothetical protein